MSERKIEIVKVPFKTKVIEIHFPEFEDTIDVEDMVKIDHTNLYAEILTIPVLMNRVGMWKAQIEEEWARAKLDRDIYIAETAERLRKELKKTVGDKVKWPTVSEVENAVTLDEVVQNHRKKVIRKQKEAAYIDSFYWAVKAKETKLNRISDSMNLTPEEFENEIVSGTYNGILIKSRSKLKNS